MKNKLLVAGRHVELRLANSKLIKITINPNKVHQETHSKPKLNSITLPIKSERKIINKKLLKQRYLLFVCHLLVCVLALLKPLIANATTTTSSLDSTAPIASSEDITSSVKDDEGVAGAASSLSPAANAALCFGGLQTFEKISMSSFESPSSSSSSSSSSPSDTNSSRSTSSGQSSNDAGVLIQQDDQALTSECVNLCRSQSNCLSFVIDYNKFECKSYATTQQELQQEFEAKYRSTFSSKVERQDSGQQQNNNNNSSTVASDYLQSQASNLLALQQHLLPSASSSYFEKICFDNVVSRAELNELCGNGRLWSVERVIDSFLDGFVDKELTNVNSKDECSKLCLFESQFVCRSANYEPQARLCRLSKEDRRSQPQAMRHLVGSGRQYLENQCATPAPSSCVYETKKNIGIISMDALKFAQNQHECQTKCNQEQTFTCRSYSYFQQRCFLSGDDSVSLDTSVIKLPTKSGWMFGEKKCLVDVCTRGLFGYEKVSGYTLKSALSSPIEVTFASAASDLVPLRVLPPFQHRNQSTSSMSNLATMMMAMMMSTQANFTKSQDLDTASASLSPTKASNLAITGTCKHSCDTAYLNCPAYTIDYRNNRCSKLDRNTQGRANELVARDGFVYFEKICLRFSSEFVGGLCKNKYWFFERVLGAELAPRLYNKTLKFVSSRRDCEEFCIEEREFQCRSALYNDETLDCKLSSVDRRLASFEGSFYKNFNPKVSYLENQCINNLPAPMSNTNETTQAQFHRQPNTTYYEPNDDQSVAAPIKEQLPKCSYEQASLEAAYPTFTDIIEMVPTNEFRQVSNGHAASNQLELNSSINKTLPLAYCEKLCNENSRFECKSFGYYASTAQCFLSGDDTTSVGDTSTSPSTGFVYFEKKCSFSQDPKPSNDYSNYPTRVNNTSYNNNPFAPTHSDTTYYSQQGRFSSQRTGLSPSSTPTTTTATATTTTLPFNVQPTFSSVMNSVSGLYSNIGDEYATTQPTSSTQEDIVDKYTQPNGILTASTQPVVDITTPISMSPTTTTTFAPIINFTNATNPHSTKCGPNHVFVYQRVPGFEPTGAHLELLAKNNEAPGIVEECAELCKNAIECRAFSVDYKANQCFAMLENSSMGLLSLKQTLGKDYFEGFCVESYLLINNCKHKAWLIDKILDQAVVGVEPQRILQESDKLLCRLSCIEERLFSCKSAMFDSYTHECHLYSVDRDSLPQMRLKFTRGVDFYENQCFVSSTTCPYDAIEKGITILTATKSLQAKSVFDCEFACSSETKFNCRSFTYMDQYPSSLPNLCVLSSDSRSTSLRGSVFERSRTLYAEHNCFYRRTRYSMPSLVDSSNYSHEFSSTSRRLHKNPLTDYRQSAAPTSRPLSNRPNPLMDHDQHYGQPFVSALDTPRASHVSPNNYDSSPPPASQIDSYARPPRISNNHGVPVASDLDTRPPPNDLSNFNTQPDKLDLDNKQQIPGASQCEVQQFSFERTFGVDFRFAPKERAPIMPSLSISVGCQAECLRRGDRCASFVVEYSLPYQACFLIESVAPKSSLVKSLTSAYFEKICLPQAASSSPEAFALVPASSLNSAASHLSMLQSPPSLMSYYDSSLAATDGDISPSYSSNPWALQPAASTNNLFRSQSTYQGQQHLPRQHVPPATGADYVSARQATSRRSCSKLWAFERFINFNFTAPAGRVVDNVHSRVNCEQICINEAEFECQSLTYDYASGTCRLFKYTRRTLMSRFVDLEATASAPTAAALATAAGELSIKAKNLIAGALNDTSKQQQTLNPNPNQNLNSGSNMSTNRNKRRIVARQTTLDMDTKLDVANIDYVENVCVPEPSSCQYGQIYDSMSPIIDKITHAASLSDCQGQCDTERLFTCRALNYEPSSRTCMLLNEDLVSMTRGSSNSHEQQPQAASTGNSDNNKSSSSQLLLTRKNSIYSEKGKCDLISVHCNAQEMLVSINFDAPFKGKIFAKGNPNKCNMIGESQTHVEFRILFGPKCNTRQEGYNTFVNEIVIQQHPVIMTDNDKTVRVMCAFEAPEQTISTANKQQTSSSSVVSSSVDHESATSLPAIIDSSQPYGPAGVFPFREKQQQQQQTTQGISNKVVGVEVSALQDSSRTRHDKSPFSSVVSSKAAPPRVVLRILDTTTNKDASQINLGDELTLKIQMQIASNTPVSESSTALGIFAKNLIAKSSAGESLLLLDNDGCPVDSQVFPALELDPKDNKSLKSTFKAFRFPSSGMVNFEVQIRFCPERCEPVDCSGQKQQAASLANNYYATTSSTYSARSFGKRRRRRRRSVAPSDFVLPIIQSQSSASTVAPVMSLDQNAALVGTKMNVAGKAFQYIKQLMSSPNDEPLPSADSNENKSEVEELNSSTDINYGNSALEQDSSQVAAGKGSNLISNPASSWAAPYANELSLSNFTPHQHNSHQVPHVSTTASTSFSQPTTELTDEQVAPEMGLSEEIKSIATLPDTQRSPESSSEISKIKDQVSSNAENNNNINNIPLKFSILVGSSPGSSLQANNQIIRHTTGPDDRWVPRISTQSQRVSTTTRTPLQVDTDDIVVAGNVNSSPLGAQVESVAQKQTNRVNKQTAALDLAPNSSNNHHVQRHVPSSHNTSNTIAEDTTSKQLTKTSSSMHHLPAFVAAVSNSVASGCSEHSRNSRLWTVIYTGSIVVALNVCLVIAAMFIYLKRRSRRLKCTNISQVAGATNCSAGRKSSRIFGTSASDFASTSTSSCCWRLDPTNQERTSSSNFFKNFSAQTTTDSSPQGLKSGWQLATATLATVDNNNISSSMSSSSSTTQPIGDLNSFRRNKPHRNNELGSSKTNNISLSETIEQQQAKQTRKRLEHATNNNFLFSETPMPNFYQNPLPIDVDDDKTTYRNDKSNSKINANGIPNSNNNFEDKGDDNDSLNDMRCNKRLDNKWRR